MEQLNSIATATELLARGTRKRSRCHGPRNPFARVCEPLCVARCFPTRCRTRASPNLKCNLSSTGLAPSFRLLPIVASTFPIGSSFTFFFLSVYTRLQFLRFATANLVGIESEVVPNRGQTVFLRGFRSILPILYAKICIRYEIASRLNELLNLFFPFLFFVYMPFSIPELFRSTTIWKNYKGNVFSRTTNTSI